jgi:hypothetical protein
MTRTLTILTIILLTAFNVFGQTCTTFKKADHYKTKKFDVAIFSANYFGFFIPGQRFTPTRQEIDQAEKSLANHLKTLNNPLVNQSSTPIIHNNLNNYKRQYFGYIDKDGNRILLINCFWAKDKDDTGHWLRDRIMTHDGGSYYWKVKFNLDKNELFDLYVNGYA